MNANERLTHCSDPGPEIYLSENVHPWDIITSFHNRRELQAHSLSYIVVSFGLDMLCSCQDCRHNDAISTSHPAESGAGLQNSRTGPFQSSAPLRQCRGRTCAP